MSVVDQKDMRSSVDVQTSGFGQHQVLLFIMGPKHPPTADDSVPLGSGRIILLIGWLTLAFVALGFTPQPLYGIGQ